MGGSHAYGEEIEKYGPEQLIALVAHGDIDYAVCDESIARTAADSIPQIDIRGTVRRSRKESVVRRV